MVWFGVLVCALLIGLAKSGFAGLAALNTPLLTGLTGQPGFAVGVLLPMLIAGDLATGYRFWGQWDKRVAVTLLPGAFLGVALAQPLLRVLGERQELFSRLLGGIAIFFCVAQLIWETRRDPQAEHRPAPAWAGLLAGTGAAIISTIAHQGGLVTNLYLLSQRLTKERFVATSFMFYFALNLIKVPGYVQKQLITAETLRYSLVAAPLVWLAVCLGARLLHKFNPRQFAVLILWLTIAVGLKLIVAP